MEEDIYTQEVHANVNARFATSKDGIYFAHQPIYGFRSPYAALSNISRYMVTKSILNALNKYEFHSFIDIGGAEGYSANVVRSIFQVPVQSTDLSDNACKMATALFGIKATPCDIHHLPFKDREFDAVLCSETIEHVTDYKQAIQELLRITNKTLVITVPHETPEMVAETIKNKIVHGHIHYFDIHSLDYLKDQGYTICYEKTLSPLLVIPRVMVEGNKKSSKKLQYQLYNFLTPAFKKLFALKSANSLTNLDGKVAKLFGKYGGITFTIEKNPAMKKGDIAEIRAESFTGITVEKYAL